MAKEITDSGVFKLSVNAKERALPNGDWGAAPRAGNTLIAHQDYLIHNEPPLRYNFEDIASFVTYCDGDIVPGDGIIFYTSNGLVGLHSRMQPNKNRIHYDFELSPELLAWKMARDFTHKKFKKFLEERLGELTDVTIFNSLATLKMNTNITFQSDFDDDRNYGFIYEEKEGKGSSKIPKELTIKVPFFTNDSPQEIPLRLSVSQPKDPDSKPLFTIEIIREERLLADNVAKLIMDLRKALPEHMILHGKI
jgi:ribosomal protein L24E